MYAAAMYAAKAGAAAALKIAQRRLESLTPDERARLRAEVTELSDAVKATVVALAAGRSQKVMRQRREAVLHPHPTAIIARTFVRILREEGPVTVAALAKRAGTAPDNAEFKQALQLATDDRLIAVECQRLMARTAESILEPHPLVRATGLVEELEGRIKQTVRQLGVVTLNELRAALDMGNAAGADAMVAFEAALAQVLADGGVEWTGLPEDPSLYAPPKEEIESPASEDGTHDLAEARSRLWRATSTLTAELATMRRAGVEARRATASAPVLTGAGDRPPKPPEPAAVLGAIPDTTDRS